MKILKYSRHQSSTTNTIFVAQVQIEKPKHTLHLQTRGIKHNDNLKSPNTKPLMDQIEIWVFRQRRRRGHDLTALVATVGRISGPSHEARVLVTNQVPVRPLD